MAHQNTLHKMFPKFTRVWHNILGLVMIHGASNLRLVHTIIAGSYSAANIIARAALTHIKQTTHYILLTSRPTAFYINVTTIFYHVCQRAKDR